MEIVDPRTDESEITDVQTLEELKAILPYFPDNEKMARYLCYISSGWTRKEARIRAGITFEEYQLFLKDDRFKEIDELPYNELREKVSNAYYELKVRKNVIQWTEFDEEFLIEVQRKLAENIELTKDERAIFLKRAGIYGPETLVTANKLLNKELDDDSNHGTEVIDIVAFIRARRTG